MIKKERELRKLPRREGLLLLVREKKRGFFFFLENCRKRDNYLCLILATDLRYRRIRKM